MVANPQSYVLSSDVEKVFMLDQNYAEVRLTVWAGPSILAFNTSNVAIGSVASTPPDGNYVLPAVLCSRVVKDNTSGTVSIVRVRAQGATSVTVEGL